MSRSRGAAAVRLDEAAPLFAALGDETRLRIVTRLCAEGPLSIARLSEGTPITRQAVTRHLESLAGAGLVTDSWQGRERVWELAPKRLEKARLCLDRISEQWDAAIDRLKDLVERDP